jgi:hypothetical protein
MDNIALQIALLRWFEMGKPLRQAAESAKFEDYTRQDIKDMKDALLKLEFIYLIPGMRTSGSMYRITKEGRAHLARLQERMEA